MANKNLHKAKKAKNDEFYTQLTDIEKELGHYEEHFKDKVVYCNCDDPYESEFFTYFASKFNELGLKKLLSTSYVNSPIAGHNLLFPDMKGLKSEKCSKKPPTIRIEINEVKDFNKDGKIDKQDVKCLLKHDKNASSPLKENGDFTSSECIEILKEADIVVTNPPFSLFREYIAQLIEHDKKFIVVGNMNAITYKEVFKLIKEEKLWLGVNNNQSFVFKTPYENNLEANIKFCKQKGYSGPNYVKVPAINWFTNLDHKKRHENIILYKEYSEAEYPKYDNYDAIEVSKVKDIPMDYDGMMGVPITFMNKYNPDQFEIIGFTHRNDPYKLKTKIYTKKDHIKFNDLNGSPIIRNENQFKRIYMRIIIRNKKFITSKPLPPPLPCFGRIKGK